MRIRFLSDQVYETEGPGRGPRFKAGLVVADSDVATILGHPVSEDFVRSWLNRWLQRKVAVIIPEGEAEGTAADEAGAGTTAAVPVDAGTDQAFSPLGTAKRGRATAGLDDGKDGLVTNEQRAATESEAAA